MSNILQLGEIKWKELLMKGAAMGAVATLASMLLFEDKSLYVAGVQLKRLSLPQSQLQPRAWGLTPLVISLEVHQWLPPLHLLAQVTSRVITFFTILSTKKQVGCFIRCHARKITKKECYFFLFLVPRTQKGVFVALGVYNLPVIESSESSQKKTQAEPGIQLVRRDYNIVCKDIQQPATEAMVLEP
jgi:hypothetical protein